MTRPGPEGRKPVHLHWRGNVIIEPAQSSHARKMAVSFQRGSPIAALTRLVVYACPCSRAPGDARCARRSERSIPQNAEFRPSRPRIIQGVAGCLRAVCQPGQYRTRKRVPDLGRCDILWFRVAEHRVVLAVGLVPSSRIVRPDTPWLCSRT